MHGSQRWVKKQAFPGNSDGPFLSGPHSAQLPVNPRHSSEANPVHSPGIRLRPVSDLRTQCFLGTSTCSNHLGMQPTGIGVSSNLVSLTRFSRLAWTR